MRCEKAAMAENSRTISESIAEAERRGIDIIAFPEMSLTGYADPVRFPEAILRLNGAEVAAAVEATSGRQTTVLTGLIEENPNCKPFITQLVIRNGKLLGYYRKNTVRGRDEEWFSAGETVPVFTHDGLTFALAICSDVATERVFAECARQGARIVFKVAAPGLYGEQADRN